MGMPTDNSIKVSLENMLKTLNRERIPYEIAEVEQDGFCERKGDFKLKAVLPLTLLFNAEEDEVECGRMLYSMRLSLRKKEACEQGLERGYEVFEQ